MEAGSTPLASIRSLKDNEVSKTMVTLESLRGEKKDDILRLAAIHGCRNVRVFGSVANSENRPESDVDFLVDLESGRNLLDLGGLLADLKELLNADVDVVETSCIHSYIRDRIIAEAVPL